MAELAVTAIGADRPGIIARVTGVLLEHGGNLEDASMTILHGQFAMMLLVVADTPPDALERDLAAATADLGLVVTVRRVGPGTSSPPPAWMLTVYGADRPGLVHAVTSALADLGANVTDLTTRVLEGEGQVYAMMLELSLPPDADPDRVRAAVVEGAPDVEVTLAPLDAATF